MLLGSSPKKLLLANTSCVILLQTFTSDGIFSWKPLYWRFNTSNMLNPTMLLSMAPVNLLLWTSSTCRLFALRIEEGKVPLKSLSYRYNDINLDMLAERESVDVLGTLNTMRRQRSTMVQTDQQYVFIYTSLLFGAFFLSFLEVLRF